MGKNDPVVNQNTPSSYEEGKEQLIPPLFVHQRMDRVSQRRGL